MKPRAVAPILVALAAAGAVGVGQLSRESPTTFGSEAVRPAQESWTFAALIEQISEEGRYFDTDNLITNERSYLHVIGPLDDLNVSGGAYIGVGPGQNFSYIAQVRPKFAFLLDIRRDNLLQHLLYKALFGIAEYRLEYLCGWLGRPCPDDLETWQGRSIEELIHYIDQTSADSAYAKEVFDRIEVAIDSFGLSLSAQDIATIRRFHGTFVSEGLDLRFTSHGRRPLPDYPTLRQLLLETDLAGNRAHYLVSDERFLFLRSLQLADRIIPVVGDLAGEHALLEIGRFLRQEEERVTAFYTSNVEYYLMRDGGFDRFIENVAALPADDSSVIIRSYFNRGYRNRHPRAVPGYSSTQLLQPVNQLLEHYSGGRLTSYWALVTGGV